MAKYSDLEYNFEIDATGNPKVVLDEEAINQSIKTILSTVPGERIMEPDFGSRVYALLFAPMDEITTKTLADTIRRAINRWENRVDVQNVVVDADEDNNRYDITIYYRILPLGRDARLNTRIRRLV